MLSLAATPSSFEVVLEGIRQDAHGGSRQKVASAHHNLSTVPTPNEDDARVVRVLEYCTVSFSEHAPFICNKDIWDEVDSLPGSHTVKQVPTQMPSAKTKPQVMQAKK